jgi:hypothetical protein
MTVEPQQATLAGARLIGEPFNSYEALVDRLRERARELRVSPGSTEFAAVSGLPERYASKLVAPGKSKRMGAMSLQPMLMCLGAKLALLEDEDAVERVVSRLPKMAAAQLRSRAYTRTVSDRKLKEWGRLGAKKRMSLRLNDAARREAN